MGLGVIVYFEICCHDLECQAKEGDIKDGPNRRHDERRDQQHLVHGLDLPLFPEVEVAVDHKDVNQLDHFHAKKDTPDQVDFSKRLEQFILTVDLVHRVDLVHVSDAEGEQDVHVGVDWVGDYQQQGVEQLAVVGITVLVNEHFDYQQGN